MKDEKERIEIIWETEFSPKADERLLKAFEIIFKGIPIELPPDQPI